MKQTLCILSLILLIFTFSCSSDDDAGTIAPEVSQLKLKRFVSGTTTRQIDYSDQGKPTAVNFTNADITYNTEGSIASFLGDEFIYNTLDQLDSINNSGTKRKFSYNSQGLMIAQTFLIIDAGFLNGILVDETLSIIYTYNVQNQIIEITSFSNQSQNGVRKQELIYNSSNQIEQIIEKSSSDSGATFLTLRVTDYLYDSKANPAGLVYNATGFESQFIPVNFNRIEPHTSLILRESITYVSSNNVRSATITDYSSGVVINTSNESITYQYDGDYPITGEITKRENGQVVSTLPLLWEYVTD
ncbi:MAG: hypothetical protein WA775_05605 [Psychroserpens sp.]|uniref:hypothetical protein n=1 Tax=Psychroserpens sp. TaxID=2020870 RepID=UPI003C74215C